MKKCRQAKNTLIESIRNTDKLNENTRLGALQKLNLGKLVLLKEIHGLIISLISGYGQTGPYSDRPGLGTLAEGFIGLTYC